MKQTIEFEYDGDIDDPKNASIGDISMEVAGGVAGEFVEYINKSKEGQFIPLSDWRQITIQGGKRKTKKNSPFSKLYMIFGFKDHIFTAAKVEVSMRLNGTKKVDADIDFIRNFGAADRAIFKDVMDKCGVSLFLPAPEQDGDKKNIRRLRIEY